jgi:hypothetical protein
VAPWPPYIHLRDTTLLILVLGKSTSEGSDILAPDEDWNTQQTESGGKSGEDAEGTIVTLGLNHRLDTVADTEAHNTSHGANDDKKRSGTSWVTVEKVGDGDNVGTDESKIVSWNRC